MELVSRDEYIAMEAARMLEGRLQYRVSLLARAYGWKFYHTHNSQRSDAGWPDCVIGKPDGSLIIRELKRQSGKPTADQAEWLAILTASGIDAGVWRPKDLLDGTIERTLRGELQ